MKSILVLFFFLTNINLISEKINITKKEFKKKEKNCVFQIYYPFFQNKNNQNFKKINSNFEKFFLDIQSYYNEFECQGENQFNLNRNFDIKLLDEKIISIHSYSSSFSEGNPHPNNSFKTFNFSLKTGDEIRLNQIYKISKSFRKKIRSLIEKNLNEQGISTGFSLDQPEYYFTKTELVFINLFEDYPNGSIEAKIHLKELANFLR